MPFCRRRQLTTAATPGAGSGRIWPLRYLRAVLLDAYNELCGAGHPDF